MNTNKSTLAYSQGRQSFKDNLDVLDDNPYNTKNIFGALPPDWFYWYDGYDDAYIEFENILDREVGL